VMTKVCESLLIHNAGHMKQKTHLLDIRDAHVCTLAGSTLMYATGFRR